MASMFSDHSQHFFHSNSNQSLSSSFFPFVDNYETLILEQQKKKRPRLASWGCGDGSFNKFGDIRYYPNQSFAFPVYPFSHEHQTLISRQSTKKPKLASPLRSVDESFDELSVIFTKPPPISFTSTAGVSKPPPDVIVIDDDEIDEETPNTPREEIEEEIPDLSDLIFDNSPLISKSSPNVIVIDDDDEEEEMVTISKANNPKLDSNGNYNEEGLGNVVIDSEKENNNGGDGGFGHVSLDELGVTVEDLKNIPWEAFDPNWEIKSAIMDPWLGPYIQQLTDF